MKKKTAVLAWADSMSDSNMLYITRFSSGDPFLYLRSGRKKTLVVTDFEMGRAEEESNADEVLPLSKLTDAAGSNDIVAAIAVLLKQKKITHLQVPRSFSLGMAHDLEKAGYKVEALADPFVPEREAKTSWEIKLITQTQRKTEKAMETAIRWIQSASVRRGTLYVGGRPLRAEMVRKRIHLQLMEEGCVGQGTIVACGDQAVDPHNIGHGPLKANKPIVIDIFPRSQETYYFADITRTIVKGKASEMVKKMFRTVREGQRIGLGMIRPGINGRKIHQSITDYFESQGFESGLINGRLQGFIHGTGHGLGLDVHEPPRISKIDMKLKAGHVVTVEPGLYYLGHGGIRIEDLAVVTAQGAKNLTRFPKVLEV